MTRKQINLKEKQSITGKNNKNLHVNKRDKNAISSKCIVEGLRIIDIRLFAKQMYCLFCDSVLSLDYVENEVRRGLASVFKIRCRDCLLMNEVSTGKTHLAADGVKLYDINSKTVLSQYINIFHTSKVAN